MSQAIKINQNKKNTKFHFWSCQHALLSLLSLVLLCMLILILLGSDLENVQNLVIFHAIWPDR